VQKEVQICSQVIPSFEFVKEAGIRNDDRGVHLGARAELEYARKKWHFWTLVNVA